MSMLKSCSCSCLCSWRGERGPVRIGQSSSSRARSRSRGRRGRHAAVYPFLDGHDRLLRILGQTAALRRPKTAGQLEAAHRRKQERRREISERGDARQLRLPPARAQLEEPRPVHVARLLQLAAHLPLRVLDRRLGLRRGLHVLQQDRLRQRGPQPACTCAQQKDGKRKIRSMHRKREKYEKGGDAPP